MTWKIWKALALALMMVLVMFGAAQYALADEDHDHAHDTREELEEAGFTPEQVDIIAEHFDELDELLESEGGHGHGDGGFIEESFALLTDPAHWLIEFVAEVAFLGFNLLIFDRLIHRHRQGKHKLESDSG